MRRFLVIFTSIFFFACSDSQSVAEYDSASNDSTQHDSVTSVCEILYDFSGFIPKGYSIMDSVIGNLNLDSYPDAILVLHPSDEEWMDQRARPVLILLGDSAGYFKLSLRNDNLTPPKVGGQMFGEPYNGTEIDSGTFKIKHYGGSRFRWTCDYVFEYDPARKTWFYVKNYGSIGDMLGEMNDLDSTGNCIPYDSASLVIRPKVDIAKFNCESAEIADLEY